jgi:hypothetical protein
MQLQQHGNAHLKQIALAGFIKRTIANLQNGFQTSVNPLKSRAVGLPGVSNEIFSAEGVATAIYSEKTRLACLKNSSPSACTHNYQFHNQGVIAMTTDTLTSKTLDPICPSRNVRLASSFEYRSLANHSGVDLNAKNIRVCFGGQTA